MNLNCTFLEQPLAPEVNRISLNIRFPRITTPVISPDAYCPGIQPE